MPDYTSNDTATITAGAAAAVLIVGMMFAIALAFLSMPPA
jgi:hypothetical protein